MKENPLENKKVLKIETIKGPNNSEVSFCAERGGIITSLKLNGKEILFLDEETLNNPEVSVRGGIPVLFPNAGPLPKDSNFPDMPQHGFARNLKWESKINEDGFVMSLSSNEETKKLYPFDFHFSLSGKFEDDGSFTLSQEVENLDEIKEMPISDGFHPYFKVPKEEKENIKFYSEEGQYIEDNISEWSNGKAVSVDNPKIKDPNAAMEVFMPSLGTLVIDASTEYKKIWVWSMSDKDFICVEPVMRNKNGLIDDPEIIKPKGNFKSKINFKLKQE